MDQPIFSSRPMLPSTHDGANVTSAANAIGGSGGLFSIQGAPGTANATASAATVGSGVATAKATASGSTGAATAISKSDGGSGKSVIASATSPVGGPASAFAQSSYGGSLSPPSSISPGQSSSVVSTSVGSPSLTLALGVMGAGYGGTGEPLTYTESADFKFNAGQETTSLLGFVNPDFGWKWLRQFNIRNLHKRQPVLH
jgi:hypothetical protein